MVKAAATKSVFVCRNCGYESAKWLGRCSACGDWNSLVEEVIEKKSAPYEWDEKGARKEKGIGQVLKVDEIPLDDVQRHITSDGELNRVLGGGIVPGALMLIGGEPGIGKSTLLLQLALELKPGPVLYVTGEESASQLKIRAERLGAKGNDCYILAESNTRRIFSKAKSLKPALLIIDSIQTMFSDSLDSTPGTITQIRECTGEIQRYAKETGVPVFLVGHITKDGAIAGPKVLEHMVDVVLQFEGDRNYNYRILRTLKNRYGSTSELGIYEMLQDGLRRVSNPSELLISENVSGLSGITIAATLEGARPMLIEAQALVTNSVYATPQRSSTGYDLRRLNMLLAVIEKRGGLQVSSQDVFLNIAGGIKVSDPGIDLAIVTSLISSFRDIDIPTQWAMAGEVGLSGEIRAVNRVEQRILEADKLGFKKMFVPEQSKKALKSLKHQCEIVYLKNIADLYAEIF